MTATRSIKIANAGDRRRAFRHARLNSWLVRALRWVLPVLAVILTGSYALFMQRTIKIESKNHSGKINVGSVSGASFENLAMTDPSYEGYNKKDGSRYRVSASRAITDLSRDKPIKLVDIKGLFERRNGDRTSLAAKNGVFDQKLGTLGLDGGIEVNAPNDLDVTLTSAVIDTKAGEIRSAEPVHVRMPSGEVRGNAMRLDQRARQIEFKDGVTATLRQSAGKKAKLDKASGPEPAPAPNGGLMAGFGSSSSAPVEIASKTLTIAEEKRTAVFEGGVRAVQNGRTLEAPTLVAALAGGATLAGLTGGADPAARSAEKAKGFGRLRQIVARDGVRLTQEGSEVVARTLIFDMETKTAELIDGVRITARGQRKISADRAEVETESNRVTLTGEVVASDEKNLLRGRRLVYEPKSGLMKLTSPPIGGAPRGDIFVRFQPPASTKAGRRPASGPMDFATSPDAPIEISARALDVNDKQSVARFEGGVRTRQGELLLTTPVMTAHYDGQIGLLNGAAGAGGGTKAPMKLRFIRAINPVSVSSGSDVKANGESAEFDMLANKVTLTGNVVLQRGRQIVRGDQLIIDLKTGLSRVKNAGPERNTAKPLTFGAAPRITADPAARDCGGQMCAVFYPQDAKRDQEARKSAKKAGGKQPALKQAPTPRLDSGWAASTTKTN
ncbi:MAG: LPS export ABC transporter periplasmic protein LptC [Alphaproteobacteria bacterium]|nr:LPS export ABC transporter periplasmic protein LptC [Alphaproteobacteria bacterium]